MGFAGLVGGVAGFVGAQFVEVVVERDLQRLGACGIDADGIGIALEQMVPQRVVAIDAEALLQQRADARIAFAAGQRVQGVALRQLARALVPVGQVHEAHPRADLAGGLHRRPLGRELGKRRVAARRALFVPVIAVDRDRQGVRQRQLIQPRIEVARPLDQHRVRPDFPDTRPHQPRTGGRVVADAEDVEGPVNAHGEWDAVKSEK